MDVSTQGVKGYEFQYKVTLYLTFHYYQQKNLKVFVEPKNDEDILFKFIYDSNEQIISVQVKREQNFIDEQKILKWLCHFEPYKSDNCLLSKLENNKSIALFVTKSRCNEDISKLRLSTIDENLKSSFEFNSSFISKINKTLENNTFFKKTNLGKQRNSFVKGLSEKFKDSKTFNNVFNRIKIIEEFKEDNIDYDICKRLTTHNGIPHSNSEKVYLLMLEAVKQARDNQTELVNKLTSILNDYRINSPKLSKNYIKREVEKELIRSLKLESKLLLTGISFCGKSEIAKKITSHYTKNGYDYMITSNIQNAESFYFSKNIKNDKILILEDPFGHIETLTNSYQTSYKLQNLINNLNSNHKIIVTSQKVVLENVYGKNALELKAWKDITIINKNEALSFWKELAKARHINNNLYEKIRKVINLHQNEKTLQIGQIEYLSRLDESELNNKNINELDTIARYNANSIGRELYTNHKEAGDVLCILSFCSDALNQVNKKELAFIFSKDKNKYTIIPDRLSVLKKDVKFNFRYAKKHKLSTDIEAKLDYIEERGFIEYFNKNINFTHPNYYEAGRFIFLNYKENKQIKFLKKILKAIHSNSSNTSYQASKQLGYFYFNTPYLTIKENIIKIAFKGINSVFPSTKDNCLIFLIGIFKDLKFNKQSEVINYITNTYDNISNISWHKEIPYKIPNHRLLNNLKVIEKDKAHELSKKLKFKEEISIKNIWHYLIYLEENNEPLTKEIFETLILNKESFIRAKATEYFFLNLNKYFSQHLVLKVFEDEHPLIVFKGLSCSFEIWYRLDDSKKAFILPLIENALERKDVAIRASNLLTTFGIDYGHESINWRVIPESKHKEMWELWHKIFITFQKNVPSSLDTHTPRFTSTMDDAISFLDKDKYMDILNCWYERLQRKIFAGLIPDDHEFSLAMNLIKSTQKDGNIRRELFHKLINQKDTSFILSSLKWFISYWEELNSHEINAIIELLKAKRKDSCWLKAVTITSDKVPPELQEIIFEDHRFLEKESKFIINNIDQNLLFDSLCVYFGEPQPLWWLALQHRNYDIWEEIHKTILLNKHETGYVKCLEKFLFEGVNGFQKDWDDKFKVWAEICFNSKDLSIETSTLIYATASCTCNLTSAKKLWDILIDEYRNKNTEDILVEKIIKNIALLQYSERENITDIIDNKILNKALNNCKPDILFFNIIDSLENELSLEIESYLEMLISSINEDNYIKFHLTFNYIKHKVKKLDLNSQLKEKLNTLPNIIQEKGKEMIKPLDKKRHYKLDNWNGKN